MVIKVQVLHKKKNRTHCSNCRGISLVAHAGNVLLKIIACRLIIVTSPRSRDYSRRNSAASTPHDRRLMYCSPCASCKSSDDRRKSPCTCASSICRKRRTLRAAVEGIHTLWRTNQAAYNYPQFLRRHAGSRAHGGHASTRNGLKSRRGCDKAMCYRRYCQTRYLLLRYTSY